jgi:hypothetical protein
VRSDPKIEEFIKSPGAVDKFTAAKGQNTAPKNTESPLVKVATGYHTILDPPPPPPPKAPPAGSPQAAAAAPAPPVVAVKFDLVATSYYASNPEQSFVLIDEPGKGLHWVKQGSAVGHLTIDTVKDGAIIVRDGQRTSEMTIKVQEPWRKLLKNPPPETSPSSSSASPASPVAQAPTGRPGPENPVQPSSVTKNPAIISPPPMPGRRIPRGAVMPPASERITSAAQPTPATGQPKPTEPVETPPPPQITQPSTAANPPVQPTEPVQTPPAPQITQPSAAANPPVQPAAPPVVDQKELKAKIDKLTAEMQASTNEEETMAKMNEMAKLLQQLEAANPPDINN